MLEMWCSISSWLTIFPTRSCSGLEAVGDHHDAAAAGALRRLDDEIVVLADDLVELVDAFLGLDDAVHLRHVDAGLERAFLGDDLVVHHRIQVPLVVLQDVIGIASVDAHHAFRGQVFPVFQIDMVQSLSRALKRNSSVRR